jgi:hypothetical protein
LFGLFRRTLLSLSLTLVGLTLLTLRSLSLRLIALAALARFAAATDRDLDRKARRNRAFFLAARHAH